MPEEKPILKLLSRSVFNKFILYFFILNLGWLQAQECNLSITGTVLDASSQDPLAYANILIQEKSVGTASAEEGTFKLQDLCPGVYHLVISHIGCEGITIPIALKADTSFTIELNHGEHEFHTIEIEGTKQGINAVNIQSNSRQFIENNPDRNLGSLLQAIGGVYQIQNGSGISKPIVHGLYGNRLSILNNEIIQSGQQWGNDHSPEIDPFAADKIKVIKGVNTLEYGGGISGAIVLVEPSAITEDDHVHAQVGYSFESNGLGHTVNARVEQNAPAFAWRLSGTFKQYGDRKAPDYLLNNTGSQEYNFALQLEKDWSSRFRLESYFSTFNTTLGVLRGSHIGNLTDLEQALVRDVPFFTEDTFSYLIDAPRQEVSHHLAKVKAIIDLPKRQNITWFVAGQLNNRKEFDVRRSQRSDIPALSLQQLQLSSNLNYTKRFQKYWQFKLGVQTIFVDNTNNPETGILPLIPDYRQLKNGLYIQSMLTLKNHQLSAGARYDNEYHYAPTISEDVPRQIITYERNFHNATTILNYTNRRFKNQLIGLSTGFAMRNPAINELYSFGLHQGVSGLEEGNINLKTEKSIKSSVAYSWTPSSIFEFSGLMYYQYFKDYIYLNPADEFRLTIRGAFPLFTYEQTNANLLGFDLSSKLTLFKSLSTEVKYSFLRGNDLSQNIPLVYMPPNAMNATLALTSKQTRKVFERVFMDKAQIALKHRYVFKQNHLLENQDFAPVPEAYYLMSMNLSAQFIFPEVKLTAFVRGENLLNSNYRDYLNRLRYFSDDQGLSIVAGANLKF